jgi:uncharacterized membrane protein YfcA
VVFPGCRVAPQDPLVNPKTILLGVLLLITAAYLVFWIVNARRRHEDPVAAERPGGLSIHTAIGFITNFFDTLGIGSFATTTSTYRVRGLVADQNIPGTLNVGHSLPTVVQALIYTTIVQVEFETLALLIASSVAGAWIGAAVVARLPKRQIQRGMGLALLAAATLMVMTALNRFPGGGDALALGGGRLALGCGINFALGALMTLGIGLYAPCMIMVSLLGMNPTAAFPIMMGSCAFLMPTCSAQFIRRQRYDLRAAIGLAIGGIPAVLIAAYIVGSLSLTYVRWLVVVVVVYTAATLLRASFAGVAEPSRRPATA